MEPLKNLLKFLLVLLLLNVFFVSISLLGAFKDIGSGYGRQLMNELAHNPFIGLFMGIFITSVIQSSSTTTSLVVGLVAGGVLGDSPSEAIELAIPIVMGSNIGTSITATIVSLAHMGRPAEFKRAFSCAIVHDFFNIVCVVIFFPLQLATNFLGHSAAFMARMFHGSGGARFSSPVKLFVAPQKSAVCDLMTNELAVRFVIYAAITFGAFYVIQFIADRTQSKANNNYLFLGGSVLFGMLFAVSSVYDESLFHTSTATFVVALGLLVASMVGFVKLMRSLVLARAEQLFHNVVFRTPALGLLFGLLVTALVQSSSVTTSIAIPLAGAGLISIHQVFPYALGANVGTTVTAILAALASGQVAGLIVAFAHFLFNVFGIVVVYPMRKIPISFAEKFAALAVRNRLVPILFVIGTYIGIPFLLICLSR